MYEFDYNDKTSQWSGGDPQRGGRPGLWTSKVVVKNIHLFNGAMPIAPGGLNHRSLYENIEVKSYHPNARRNQILSSTFQRSTLRNVRGAVKQAWMFELKGGACRTVLDGCRFVHTGDGGEKAMVSLSEGDYNIHFVNCEFVWTNEHGDGVGNQPNMMLGCHGGRIHRCLLRHEYVVPMSQAATRFIFITDAFWIPSVPITATKTLRSTRNMTSTLAGPMPTTGHHRTGFGTSGTIDLRTSTPESRTLLALPQRNAAR